MLVLRVTVAVRAKCRAFDSSEHNREHVNAMAPEVIKFRMLSTTGSDCRSRVFLVSSLLIQLLLSGDVRASDNDALRHPLKQTFAGACNNNCSVVKAKKNENKMAETMRVFNLSKFRPIQRPIISSTKLEHIIAA